MTIFNIEYQNKNIPLYAAKLSLEEKKMKARLFDQKIKEDYKQARNIKSCKHVCSYIYKGCVFAWESLSENVLVDQQFALSLDLPQLQAELMNSQVLKAVV